MTMTAAEWDLLICIASVDKFTVYVYLVCIRKARVTQEE